MTQILNIDSGNFSNTVLQDVQEIRIQEAGYENAIQSRSNDKKKEYLDCLPYFEYSMGGNLKFYKEHLQHDFELEDKVFGSMNNLEPRVRQSSHSDNDSEPESLRYARKPQEKVMPIINTITEEPELSFDDYSSIYQPEFMLNINSQSLVKEMPKKALIENAYLKKAIDNKKKDKSADQNLCQDISDSISKTLVNNVEIHVASKSKVLPVGKGNDVLNKHEDCMFDYQSPLVTTNTKQLEKPQIKSKLNKSTENQRLMSENFDKNTTFSIKNETTSFKLKAVKITNNETTAKHNINETFPTQKQSKTPLDHTSSAPAKNKMRLKYRAQMTDFKEKSKKLGQEEGYNSKNVVMPQLTRKNILPRSKNIQSTDKAQVGSFLSDSEMNIDMVKFNNKDLFDELELTKQTLSEKTLKRSTEFYPESPISEVHFFKTPCSTRHNSLETFEQLESECIEQNIEQVSVNFVIISFCSNIEDGRTGADNASHVIGICIFMYICNGQLF